MGGARLPGEVDVEKSSRQWGTSKRRGHAHGRDAATRSPVLVGLHHSRDGAVEPRIVSENAAGPQPEAVIDQSFVFCRSLERRRCVAGSNCSTALGATSSMVRRTGTQIHSLRHSSAASGGIPRCSIAFLPSRLPAASSIFNPSFSQYRLSFVSVTEHQHMASFDVLVPFHRRASNAYPDLHLHLKFAVAICRPLSLC